MDIPTATLQQYEDEKTYELENASRARQQYINALVSKTYHTDGTVTYKDPNVSDTDIGKRIVYEMVGDGRSEGILKAMRDLRADCLEMSKNGRTQPCYLVMLDRSPEELAFLAANVLLSHPSEEAYKGSSHISLAVKLARLIKDSMDLDAWIQRSRESKKDGGRDDAKYMLASVKGHVSERTFGRWKSKIKDLSSEPWDQALKVSVGVPILHVAVANSGGWFSLETVRQRNVTKMLVRLTPLGISRLNEYTDQTVLSARIFRPMICPPVPWERVNAGTSMEME